MPLKKKVDKRPNGQNGATVTLKCRLEIIRSIGMEVVGLGLRKEKLRTVQKIARSSFFRSIFQNLFCSCKFGREVVIAKSEKKMFVFAIKEIVKMWLRTNAILFILMELGEGIQNSPIFLK